MREANRMKTRAPDTNKPHTITRAVALLWGSLGAVAILALIGAYQLQGPDRDATIMTMLAVSGAVLGLFAMLIVFIHAGKNWARITGLVVFVLTLVQWLPGVFIALPADPVSALITLLLLSAQGYAYYLLFTDPARSWFASPTPPTPS